MEISLSKIAEIIEGEVRGDAKKVIRGASSFEDASSDDITFAGGPKYLKKINETDAGAVIVPKDFDKSGKNLVLVENPQLAFIKVLECLNPASKPVKGIHKTAIIGENVICGQDASIGPFVFIADNVNIGDRTILHPGTVIGNHVTIGSDVEIHPNVTVYAHCRIGSRVIIHSGTVIGSDGFGFEHDGEKYCKIPQLGIVQIDDDVEIGANNAIDRATFGRTWIKQGVKTDNLVHIAHNVVIGENSALAGQVGIAGSTTIGKNCRFAGQAGISGHITIDDNVTVGPKSGVAKSVSEGETVSGILSMPHKLWLRTQRIIPNLPELKKKISDIEKRLKQMENNKK